jgi:hypothetical protein
MRRLVLFVVVAAALLAVVGTVTWWVDPFGEVWKPGAIADARADGCLVSQELIGVRYLSFKLDVFRHRPTRTFVVGSSRVLKLAARPGESSFSNLGYPGTAPETIRALFRALPAAPRQTVYIGVESFWFNENYVRPDTSPGMYTVARYLLSRSAFWDSVELARQAAYVRTHRWRKTYVGAACTIGRTYPSINWRLDGSRVWSWELDPKRYPRFHETPYTGDLAAWRNGYYDNWTSIDRRRLRVLADALALARSRGWRVVGFEPPEPLRLLRVLNGDPRVAPRWHEVNRILPALFHRNGDAWIGRGVVCPDSQFPDAFHTDAACSARLRVRLDEAARRLH